MKVTLLEKDELLIEPETDFEAEYLQRFKDMELTVFHKSGISTGDYVGIKIKSNR